MFELLKYFFKPTYSIFECLSLMYVTLIMFSVGFWWGSALLLATIIVQITMTNQIHKQESIEQEMNQ
jgi:uncharacterized membrane protein